MALERSLVLIKPDAIGRGLAGEILARIERRGCTLHAGKLVRVSRDLAERHYDEHKEKPFFGELVEFITSGPTLALVVEGRADAALLDTYEEERIPVARRLLNSTDRAFRLVVSDSRLAGLLRTVVIARIAAFAMSVKRIQSIAFRTISQTGIQYRESSLSK